MSTQPERSPEKGFSPAAGWALAGLTCVGCLTVFLGCGQEGTDERKQAPPQVANSQPPPKTEKKAAPQKPRVEELRAKYPYESLARRLEYEKARAAALARKGHAPLLTEATNKRLEGLEKWLTGSNRWDARARSLAMLHSDQAEQFISRDGMGVSRMVIEPSTIYLELPDAAPIALPEVGSASAEEEPGERVALPRQGGKGPGFKGGMPSLDLLATFHQGGLFNFLSPGSFGHVRDRDHVAGFRAHQFRHMPELADPRVPAQQAAKQKERWEVRRLELVSLLKYEEPAVYVSEYLPRMDALQKAVTRPLTSFEEKALKELRKGEDLVAEATAAQIRMMGSLRASKQCLACHDVKRGELLGAFSYKLGRSSVKGGRK
jgi:hypothetical protein